MRRDIFNESKIIKKDELKENTNNPIPQNNNTFNNDELSIKINNQNKPEPENNSGSKLTNNNKNNIININKDPLFVYQRNKYTKQIDDISTPQNVGIYTNITNDRLKVMLGNTINYLNELEIDINILEALLSNSNDMFEFYKQKIEYYEKEYIYNKNKKNILERMLK